MSTLHLHHGLAMRVIILLIVVVQGLLREHVRAVSSGLEWCHVGLGHSGMQLLLVLLRLHHLAHVDQVWICCSREKGWN